MNNLTIEQIKEITRLAQESNTTDSQSVSFNSSGVSYEINGAPASLADIEASDPAEKILINKIGSLNDEALVELCALMQFGRAKDNSENWPLYLSDVHIHTGLVDYIASKRPLAQYLKDGFQILRSSGLI